MAAALEIDPSKPLTELIADLVDIPSVSGDEQVITNAVERALATYDRFAVQRLGNVVIVRTELGRAERVVIAGHLDTVPIADNVPSRIEGGRMFGCGTSDMKSGIAIMLQLAHLLGTGQLEPGVDLTFVFYDCEEVEAARNGLNFVAAKHRELLQADLALLLEPTNGIVEGGCQGTLRVLVRADGVRAHSARGWLGHNAIHAAAPILARLADYTAAVVDVEGLSYREGLNAVGISGGIAGNVIPDRCEVTVNYRFAPDKSATQALAHLHQVFDGYSLEVLDSAPGARPGLDQPLAKLVVEAFGAHAEAKLGWTDVARFAELGIPALNVGPGDPNLAHTVDESVDLAVAQACASNLASFLRRGAIIAD